MENQGCFVCAREGASMAGAKKMPALRRAKNNLGHISSWIIKYLPVVAGKYLPLIYLPYDVLST
ncbi:TPA: hypothetical protein JJK42_003779 [Escherichia coli]|nr:hypothetical protein [Escherichia coli]HAV7000907.1 hypothetical protein [Escherichia coli]